MTFESHDTRITIECDHYCFVSDEPHHSSNGDRVEIMKIYWNYSNPDGWGSISEEYIFVDDIKELNKKLKELEYGVRDSLDMDFYGLYKEIPFISLHIKRSEFLYSVDLKVYDGTFSEYIAVCCPLSEGEWQSCADELMGWGKKYSLRLGDKVETLIHHDDSIFPLGRIGEVTEIYPETEQGPACVAVSFTDIGWDKKPYQNTRLYDFDEVRRVAEA